MPNTHNDHPFAGISITTVKDPVESLNQTSTAPTEGVSFQPISENDVVLAVAILNYFKSQAKGDSEIPHSMIRKALTLIKPFMAKLFNASQSQGVLPQQWKIAELLTSKKVPALSNSSDSAQYRYVLPSRYSKSLTTIKLLTTKALLVYSGPFRLQALVKLTTDTRAVSHLRRKLIIPISSQGSCPSAGLTTLSGVKLV